MGNKGNMRGLAALGVMLLLVACASMTPEQQYKQAYDTVSAGVNTTTALLDRELISSRQARQVLTIGVTTKSVLDEAVADLEKCRAAGGDCKTSEASIKMASKISLALEAYLEELEQP